MKLTSQQTQSTLVRKQPIDIANEVAETNTLLMIVIATIATFVFVSIALSNKEAIIDKPLIAIAYTIIATKITLLATSTIGQACYESDLRSALLDSKI